MDEILNLCDCKRCSYCDIIDSNNLRLIGGDKMEGYCLKCKGRKEIINAQNKTYETTKGVKYGVQGNCKECGCKISIMVKGG